MLQNCKPQSYRVNDILIQRRKLFTIMYSLFLDTTEMSPIDIRDHKNFVIMLYSQMNLDRNYSVRVYVKPLQ